MGARQSSQATAVDERVQQVAEAAQYATGAGLVDKGLSSSVEFTLSCRQLRKVGDYKVVVNEFDVHSSTWGQVGETELISVTDAPAFIRSVSLQYAFEVQQSLRFDLLEVSGDNRTVCGVCYCSVAEVVSARSGLFEGILHICPTTYANSIPPKAFTKTWEAYGLIFVSSDEVGRPQMTVTFDVSLKLNVLGVSSSTTLASKTVEGRDQPTNKKEDLKKIPREFRNLSFNISRTNPRFQPWDVGWVEPVYRSEFSSPDHTIDSTRHPHAFHFNQVSVRKHHLARDDDRGILFEVRNDKLFTYGIISLKEMKRAASTKKPLAVLLFDKNQKTQGIFWNPGQKINSQNLEISSQKDPVSRKKSKYLEISTSYPLILEITKCTFTPELTFLDYVLSGLEISLVVAVDFSLSGKNLHAKDRLDFAGPETKAVKFESPIKSVNLEKQTDPEKTQKPAKSQKSQKSQTNIYIDCILAVGEILEWYDSDKKIPCYGFSGKLPPNFSRVSQCFAMNGDFFKPNVDTLNGVVNAYKESLKVVELFGPSELAPVLKCFRDLVSEEIGEEISRDKYFILLIVTDGSISDFQAAVDEVVLLAELPVSIVIVGVQEDGELHLARGKKFPGISDKFRVLRLLDGDEEGLKSSDGKAPSRDIVQFVEFSSFKNRYELAVEVLAEIPREVVGFFRKFETLHATELFKQNHISDIFRISQNDRVPKNPIYSTAHNPPNPVVNPESNSMILIARREKLLKNIHRHGYPKEAALKLLAAGLPTDEVHNVIDSIVWFYQQNEIWKKQGKKGFEIPPRSPDDYLPHWICQSKNFQEISILPSLKPGNSLEISSINDDRSECKICLSRKAWKFLPCGHRIVCQECAQETGILCPLCRQTVDSLIY